MLISFSLLLLIAFTSGEITSRQAGDEEFPFQVSIRDLRDKHLCGGAIITSKWVLTTFDCVKRNPLVLVGYGSADSNRQKKINGVRIIPDSNMKLALVELTKDIEFTIHTKQAKLPRMEATYRNSTKLSGWKLNPILNEVPVLHVIDKYYLVFENCRTHMGTHVHLAEDEFCGFEENTENILYLSNGGTTVSKSAILLGMLTKDQVTPIYPAIYTNMAKYGQWIKDVLQRDADYITWVDEIPKDSATLQSPINLALLGISAIFLSFFNIN